MRAKICHGRAKFFCVVATAFILAAANSGCDKTASCKKRLQGRWQSPLMEMAYDFERSVAFRKMVTGDTELYPIAMTFCEGNQAAYRSKGVDTSVFFLDDGRIKLASLGKIETEFNKIADDAGAIDAELARLASETLGEYKKRLMAENIEVLLPRETIQKDGAILELLSVESGWRQATARFKPSDLPTEFSATFEFSKLSSIDQIPRSPIEAFRDENSIVEGRSAAEENTHVVTAIKILYPPFLVTLRPAAENFTEDGFRHLNYWAGYLVGFVESERRKIEKLESRGAVDRFFAKEASGGDGGI
ncbi:hypothetical protein K8I61_17170 [bacterium]|nr:hypothetical protein [bacterium]